MIYSKTCEYAIRGLSYLAAKADQSPATITEISAKTKVPQTYVAKTFQCLIHAGILGSRSGPGGGYFFRVAPSRITLLRVMRTLDNFSESSLSKCVMGQVECHDKNPCALHDIWMKAKEEIIQRLRTETITDVVRMKNGAYWNKKRRVVLSKRMQNIFGYKAS